MRASHTGIRFACMVAALGLSLAASTPAFADVSVAGNGATGTKDCGGGSASISGNQNKLTLKNCKSVSVMGNKNVVDAGLVSSISAMGNQNTIYYKVGPKKQQPSISNLGSGNKIIAR